MGIFQIKYLENNWICEDIIFPRILYNISFNKKGDMINTLTKCYFCFLMWKNFKNYFLLRGRNPTIMTVKYIMLASMSNKLQRQHEDMDVPSILFNLKKLYWEQSQTT